MPCPDPVPTPNRRALLFGAGLILAAWPALARVEARGGLELLAVTSGDCPASTAWLAETAPGLARPSAGMPSLLLVDLDGPYPDGLLLDALPRMTPTFILLRQGAELGRFDGYQGKDHFHATLKALLKQTGQTAHGVRP
ncbi:SoxS protein [Paracoccus bogoriensis]|uniref:SoxS protein n=1 Tax=Paracoccus bogoriensis TaxID=242065 RepID=UPI001CA48489|nr:SoxS protein [Paracoccus bogoriensis]MBW7056768.1 SoxS protein [Paracoccus bogoriensis]